MTNKPRPGWLNPASLPQTLLEGDLDFYPDAILPADDLFSLLFNEIPWQQGFITLYGNRHKIPRLQCWMADSGLDYRYSGENLVPVNWTATLRDLCNELNQHFDLQLNSVLCNLYRNGNDSMGWHADDEPELGYQPRIMSLTLGSERDFALRRTGSTKQAGKLLLPSGSVLDMKPGMQSRWQHAVPRRRGISSPRINLTFRQIILS